MGSHRGCASRPAGLGACSCSRSSAPSGCAGCSPQAPGVSLTTMRSSTRKYGLGTHTCLAHAGRLRACPTCCGSRPRCRPRRCCARRCCACTQRGADARFAQCSAAPTAQGRPSASAASTYAGSQRPGWFDCASRTKPVAGHKGRAHFAACNTGSHSGRGSALPIWGACCNCTARSPP